MVAFLERRIEDFSIGGKDKHLTFQECAEFLLKEIEEVGMMPPISEENFSFKEIKWEEE